MSERYIDRSDRTVGYRRFAIRLAMRIHIAVVVVFFVYLVAFSVIVTAGRFAAWELPGYPSATPGCYQAQGALYPITCKGFPGSSVATSVLNLPLVFVEPMRAFSQVSKTISEPVAAFLTVILWGPVIYTVAYAIQVRWSRRDESKR